MNNKEIDSAINLLIEQLDRNISALNSEGAEQILASNHESAKKILTKIEYVNTYRDRVSLLKDEWQRIERIISDENETLLPQKIIRPENYPVSSREKYPSNTGYKTITLAKENKKQSMEEVYDLKYHLQGKSSRALDLFSTIRKKIKELAPNAEEKFNKMYIRYSDPLKFCEIRIQSEQLKIWIAPPIEKLNDVHRLCRDVRNIGHYGTGASEVFIKRSSDIELVFDLIKQSYKYSKQYIY